MTENEFIANRLEKEASYFYALARHHAIFGALRPLGRLRDAQLDNAARYQRIAAVISDAERSKRLAHLDGDA